MRKKTVKRPMRRQWSAGDFSEFKKLARSKTPCKQIAKRFRRTEGAIRQKALRHGISLNSRA